MSTKRRGTANQAPDPAPRARGRAQRPVTRLDQLVADRALAPSRERARALILAGHVRVAGQVVSKAGAAVSADAEISLDAPDHPYVSRGGVKLAHALNVFGIDPSGRRALDVGASTGGFTDVLLCRGAHDVIALDVGHGQLDWRIRNDARVIVQERVNARAMTRDHVPHPVSLVTIDVSFISLRHIFPALLPYLAPSADVVALVKPQFEAGRAQVEKGGLVKDPNVHAAVLAQVVAEATRVGFTCVDQTPSPITGATGNQEFFVHLKRRGERADEQETPRGKDEIA